MMKRKNAQIYRYSVKKVSFFHSAPHTHEPCRIIENNHMEKFNDVTFLSM